MRQTRQLDLRCYPKEDREFLDDAQRAVAECRETVRRAERLLGKVEAKLRDRYPQVRIKQRETLATPTEDAPEVWYCYRDGNFAA